MNEKSTEYRLYQSPAPIRHQSSVKRNSLVSRDSTVDFMASKGMIYSVTLDECAVS